MADTRRELAPQTGWVSEGAGRDGVDTLKYAGNIKKINAEDG